MEVPEQQADLAPRGGPPILAAFLALGYGAAGLAFYLYSGRAEGMISPRLGFLLVALTSIPLGGYMLAALIFHFRWPPASGRWLIIAGIAASEVFDFRLRIGNRQSSIANRQSSIRSILRPSRARIAAGAWHSA